MQRRKGTVRWCRSCLVQVSIRMPQTRLVVVLADHNLRTVSLLRTVHVMRWEIDGDLVMLQDGWTALIFACQEGYSEVVQKLLKAGAKKEAADKVGGRVAGQAHHLRAVVFMNPNPFRGVRD